MVRGDNRAAIIAAAAIFSSVFFTLLCYDIFIRPHTSSYGWETCTIRENATYEACYWTAAPVPYHLRQGGGDRYFRGNVNFPPTSRERTLRIVSDDCVGELRINEVAVYSNDLCDIDLTDEADHIVTEAFSFPGWGQNMTVAAKVNNRLGSYSPLRFYIMDERMTSLIKLIILMLSADVFLFCRNKAQWIPYANAVIIIALTHLYYPVFPETWGLDVLGRFSPGFTQGVTALAAAILAAAAITDGKR